MNALIADIIKLQIENLPFIDKIAGLVIPITYSQDTADGKSIKKTFPVSCDVTHNECINGKIMDLVPDDRYKSVSYFEDLGTNIIGTDQHNFDFESRLKFVCWLNLKKLGKTDCEVSALAIAAILKKLKVNFNHAPLTRIVITMIGQDIKNSSIFSKYTYNDEQMQYLMYPFDYFAITIKTSYRLPYKCVDDWTNSIEIKC